MSLKGHSRAASKQAETSKTKQLLNLKDKALAATDKSVVCLPVAVSKEMATAV